MPFLLNQIGGSKPLPSFCIQPVSGLFAMQFATLLTKTCLRLAMLLAWRRQSLCAPQHLLCLRHSLIVCRLYQSLDVQNDWLARSVGFVVYDLAAVANHYADVRVLYLGK